MKMPLIKPTLPALQKLPACPALPFRAAGLWSVTAALCLGGCAQQTPPPHPPSPPSNFQNSQNPETTANANANAIATASDLITFKVAGLNDFHGNIEPLSRPLRLRTNPEIEKSSGAGSGSSSDSDSDSASASESGAEDQRQEVHAGGAATLANAVQYVTDQSPHHLVIAAGDLIGASPLASSYFLDEPAIGAMNRIGLDFNAVGNHEFDRGWRELKRLAEGGCEKHALRPPCQIENPFPGASFQFLAANVMTQSGETLFPASAIKRFQTEGGQEIAVGVIGLTLKDTPTLVSPGGVEGLRFADEAATINALIPQLKADGANAIIVSIHQGLYTKVGYNDTSCGGVSGPLLDILARLDPRVDLVITGHTHRAYICDYSAIDPRREFLVTSAGYGGSMLSDITLKLDAQTGDVRSKSAENIVVQTAIDGRAPNPAFRAFPANEDLSAYVARYVAASRDAAARLIGKVAAEGTGSLPAPIARGPSTGESILGNLIADAQLSATRKSGAQIALMNNSGIRADIVPGEDGAISFGDIYAAQPFGNTLVTKSFSGAQLLQLLEQQFDDEGFQQSFAISDGFTFAWDAGKPSGARIVWARLNGANIDPSATYRVTMNSFLAEGGDRFSTFTKGTNIVIGPVDLDAMESYLSGDTPLPLPQTGRISALAE